MRKMRIMNLLFLGIIVLSAGCAKQPPQEVTDLTRMWTQTRDECATLYAQEGVRGLEPDMNELNALMADEKYRKARKKAETLEPRVGSLRDSATQAAAAARSEAEAAIASATQALAKAEEAGALEYAEKSYGSARDTLNRARREMSDPCGYYRARDLAAEAEELAGESVAAAEKARLEKERREAERRAEEARRLAEERRLREKPPEYSIERGNSLWSIAGMEKIYGDPLLWPLLYEANGKLIKDPDLIFPNNRLTVPRGISEADMRAQAQRFYRSYKPEPAD